MLNVEHKLMQQVAPNQTYEALPHPHKLGTNSHTHTHALTHIHTHTYTYTHTHMHSYTQTHTHAHTRCLILQNLLYESVKVFRFILSIFILLLFLTQCDAT